MPNLHYFNPGHETAVLNGSPYYMPPANVALMQRELAFLPAWYGRTDDYVWMETRPPAEFMEILRMHGLKTATPLTCEYLMGAGNRYPSAKASPWGMSPQSLFLYEQLREKSGWALEVPEWDEVYARLCGRQTAALCLRTLLNLLPQLGEISVPRFYTSLSEVEAAMAASNVALLAKSPYSSSGRGLLWLYNRELTKLDRQWLFGNIKKQGSVSLEPVLNKKQDFAMEFFSDGMGTICYEGLSFFFTAEQGGYTGNYLGPQQMIYDKLAAFIGEELLDEVRQSLEQLLREVYGSLYMGYLGVDMMIYEDASGRLRLHPCVEINMRYTMGMVALKLSESLISSDVEGLFAVEYYPKAGDALWLHQHMQKMHPLRCVNGRVAAGYMSLCPITSTTFYTATLLTNK